MITLITGLPGNGKTLYAIDWTRRRAEAEGRQVYYSGIKDCMVPGWIELPTAEEWPKLPTGSIVLIDEVQRVMRPRQHGSNVPDHVAKLETHRHMGVDLVLITQDPMLLDNNARRLVGQHFHIVRKFGTHMATIHEWNAVKEQAAKNREDSIRHEWRYPSEVFGLYKSAELHTHKRRIPMKVWLLLASPIILGAIVWLILARIDPTKKAEPSKAQQMTAGPAMHVATSGAGAGLASKLTPQEYTAQFVPRVQGLAYTAPAYDEVTKPVHAPYPAACIQSADRCNCYTQQGTRLETGKAMCESIAAGGFFVAWAQPVAQAVPLAQRSEAPGSPNTGLGGPISLGGDPRGHIKATAPAAHPPGEQDPAPTPIPGRRVGPV